MPHEGISEIVCARDVVEVSRAMDIHKRGENAFEDIVGGSVVAAPFVPGFVNALIVSK